MRRFLVLTIALALVFVGLYPRSALTQEPLHDCPFGLPSLSDFPEAAPDCKNKLPLAPIPVTPDVIFTLTVRCGLSVTVCRGVTKCWKSEPKKKEDGACKPYYDMVDELAKRTICCDPKCEKPTPWFGSSSFSGCRDVQSPEIEPPENIEGLPDTRSLVTVRICGIDVFHDFPPKDFAGGSAAYKAQLADFVKQRVGSKVCCDKLREAVRTKNPCDPTDDIDCDGKRNTNDFHETKVAAFPDINNLFDTPAGAPVDPFPTGLNPDEPNFLPPPEKCDCKWELIRGSLTCSPDGIKNHVYQATWSCPSTGNSRFTKKEAPATAKCGPEPKTMGFFLLFSDRQYTNDFSNSFLGSLQEDRARVVTGFGTNRARNVNGWQ